MFKALHEKPTVVNTMQMLQHLEVIKHSRMINIYIPEAVPFLGPKDPRTHRSSHDHQSMQ